MNRAARLLLLIPLILLSIIALVIAFSPYGPQDGYGYRVIATSVRINASPEHVFAYLGDSRNAQDWSVFVDHIIPLNADQVADGLPGSMRRCFQQADQKGIWWDETITEVIPNTKREIEMNKLHGFWISVPHLATEQRYTRTPAGGTELTFTLFLKNYDPTAGESIKMYAGAYQVQRIFRKNLENIRREVDGREHSGHAE